MFSITNQMWLLHHLHIDKNDRIEIMFSFEDHNAEWLIISVDLEITITDNV